MIDPAAAPSEAPAAASPDAALAAPPSAAPLSPGADGVLTPLRPEGIPDELWANDTGLKTDELIADYRTKADRIAALEAAQPVVPESADKYEVKLPDTFAVPDGFKVEIDAKSPDIALVRQMAHERGWTQKHLSDALEIEAARQVEGQKQARAFADSERAKLGDRGAARIEGARNWLGANLPSGQANALASLLFSAEAIQAIETLQQRASAGGMPSSDTQTTPAPRPVMAERMYGAPR